MIWSVCVSFQFFHFGTRGRDIGTDQNCNETTAIMKLPELNLQGRALYRVMSLSCAIVSNLTRYLNAIEADFTTQAFMMFGYDAGVLGGVQTTEPFLNAMGVCSASSDIFDF